ncbi:FHA domain-containing protein [Chloroflexota bacterium]
MDHTGQQTLFALDCGATNWRLYRSQYHWDGARAVIIGEPQASPLTCFSDRKLPAAILLNPAGNALESIGEVARQNLEDENKRERVRDHFKPCIGAYLQEDPLPHQKRYTHTQAMKFTRMLLSDILKQVRMEKWRGEKFDDRTWFSFAYPIHWRYDHDGAIFKEFKQLVQECFEEDFKQIRFVAEPEGAILSLQQRGLLQGKTRDAISLIIDVGGSTTDIIAGQVDPKKGQLKFLGRYGEAFGGGLYDAELAKYITDELKVPGSALADDPSALLSIRRSGQHLKESLSRQILSSGGAARSHNRSVTLVMKDGDIFRRSISLNEELFREISTHLDQSFNQMVTKAHEQIKIPPDRISQVVLVGGGSQLFTIMTYLRDRYGSDKVVLADNPDEVVVQGVGLEYKSSFEDREATILFQPGDLEEDQPPNPIKEISQWFLKHADQKIALIQGVNSMGRSESNHIQVEDIKASRLHAEIILGENTLEISDKGSTNGTYLNGKLLQPFESVPLVAGDIISIGKNKYEAAASDGE